MLAKIRSVIPAYARERWYIVSNALVSFLTMWGLLDASLGQQIATLAIASITLLFAILYSTDEIRTAIYTLVLAVQAVAQVLGILTDQQWGAIVALVAILLGQTLAAAKTPAMISVSGRHAKKMTAA